MRTDAELRQTIADCRRQLRERSRKRKGLPKRPKGKMCRPVDRDEAAKIRRGYKCSGSYVRLDGSERLVGSDWQIRKEELRFRSGGLCERWEVLRKPHADRCDMSGEEPHHIIKRSTRRDDRLQNLANLSHACHAAEDQRKIGGRK